MAALMNKINKMPPFYQKVIEDYVNHVYESNIEKPSIKQEDLSKEEMPLFGAFKGKIWMSPDFDEPLEDLKDYM